MEKEKLVKNYNRHLTVINGIKFTFREIEVISCLIHGRNVKKTSILLNISPKTTETHIRNITAKIECNSREGIIDFIEKSGKIEIIRHLYNHLIDPSGLIKNEKFPYLKNNNSNLSEEGNAFDSLMETAHIEAKKENVSVPLFYSGISKKVFVKVGCILFLCSWGIFLLIKNIDKKEPPVIHTNLIAPVDSISLERPHLLQQMGNNFNNSQEIPSLALIGPGGTGKTTLVHQYTQGQKSSVIWEINGENSEILKSSFAELSYTLSATEEDKDELSKIEKIKHPKVREHKRLLYIQKNFGRSLLGA